ncbi:MAG TPA: VTT domain-containing protein [Pyrinomonadaceae bacterium]
MWKKRSILLVAGLLAVVAGVFLLSYSETFRNLIDSITLWAKDLMAAKPLLGVVVFFLFSMLSAMLAFASSAALVPPANLVWGKFVTFLLLWSGWLTGAVVAYQIGRLARPLLMRLGYKEKIEKYQEYVSRRTKFWMILLFCFAVPSEIPGYVLGGVHFSFWRFLIAMAISEGIYAGLIVLAGQSLLSDNPLPLMLILGALVLIGAIAGMLFRKFRKRRSRKQ